MIMGLPKSILMAYIMILAMICATLATQQGCLQNKCAAKNWPLSDDDIEFILKTHNDIREEVQEADLPPLVWDEELAEEAQNWANTCNYWHHGLDWGENIAYDDDNGPQNVQEAIESSMSMWMLEKTFDTDGDFGCCVEGHKTCCHYTQVLWKDTTSVGCGFSRCDNMDQSIYTVCYYQPR